MEKLNTRMFLKVAETGSFKKTANKLGYTQAGVSYIINAMEEELGVRLFQREYGGVHLTKEGEMLLPFIRQIHDDYRVLEEKLNDIRGLKTGTIKVQVFDSISIHWIPGILKKFQEDYPGIQVELITVEDSRQAESMVYHHEVDCGFFLSEVQTELEVIPLMEEAMKAVVAVDHPLADREVFPVKELGNYPYIRMMFDENTGISRIFKKNNVKPQTAYRVDNDYSAMAMVSVGLGFCIFPELLLQDMPYQMRCLDFDEPMSRTISLGLRSRETVSDAVLKFIEYAQEWIIENVPTEKLTPELRKRRK